MDIITVFLQNRSTVTHPSSFLLLNEVICKVSGQALAPISFLKIYINRVSPPVVKNLMRIGGMKNKRKADHTRT